MPVVRHNLYVLMAQRGIKSIKELSRLTGIEYPTLYNFYTYIHKKLDPELISILCTTLKCEVGELLFLNNEESEVKLNGKNKSPITR